MNLDLLTTTLVSSGYCVISEPVAFDEFIKLAEQLGPVMNIADVKLHHSERALHRPESMLFHTDYLAARYVGWWCVWQDESVGESLLVDGHRALAHLAPTQLDPLTSMLTVSHGRERMPAILSAVATLLTRRPGWRLSFEPDSEFSPHVDVPRGIQAFFGSLAAEHSAAGPVIRLMPRQALIIDNWRMLHRRDALPPNSGRYLKRVWIETREPLDQIRIIEAHQAHSSAAHRNLELARFYDSAI
jgi:hypothetical protein